MSQLLNYVVVPNNIVSPEAPRKMSKALIHMPEAHPKPHPETFFWLPAHSKKLDPERIENLLKQEWETYRQGTFGSSVESKLACKTTPLGVTSSFQHWDPYPLSGYLLHLLIRVQHTHTHKHIHTTHTHITFPNSHSCSCVRKRRLRQRLRRPQNARPVNGIWGHARWTSQPNSHEGTESCSG